MQFRYSRALGLLYVTTYILYVCVYIIIIISDGFPSIVCICVDVYCIADFEPSLPRAQWYITRLVAGPSPTEQLFKL